MSKLLKTQIVRSTTSRPTTTRIWGSVIWMNDCHGDAPSSWAASYWSLGTVWSAESTLTMISGAPNQILMNTSVGNTSPPLLKNWGALWHSPIFTRKLGKKPDTPFKIHFQDRAMTIDGNAQGIISSVR